MNKLSIINKWKCYRGIIIILVISSVLILYNISNHRLWNDEASTAAIGYNTMKYGYPIVYDGKNLISSSDGNSFNDNLLATNYDWLPFYIIAVSFKLFGTSELTARVPFAVFGICSILIIWLLAYKIYCDYRKANALSVIYLLNVQFLLYCRQARNYTLAMFFIALSTLLLFQLLDMIKLKKSYKDKRMILYSFLFMVSVACIMHSSRLLGAVWIFALVTYLILLHNIKNFILIIPAGIGVSTWLIWYFFTHIYVFSPSFGTSSLETHYATKIIMILWKIQVYFIPILSLVLIYLLFLILQRIVSKKQSYMQWDHKNWFFVLLVVGNILATTIPKWSIVNHYYLAVLVAAPFLTYPILQYVWDNSKTICITLFIIMVTTNLLNIWPYYLIGEIPSENNEVNNLLSENYSKTTNMGIISSPDTDSNFRITSLNSYVQSLRVRSFLYEYLVELASDYYCYVDEIIDIFKQYNVKEDNVAVVGFEYTPYVFYTDVRIANNMNNKLTPWPDFFSDYPNRDKYSHLTYVPDNEIDWVIIKADGIMQNYVDDVNHFYSGNFEVIQTKTIDSPLANSPDLDLHNFITVTEGDNITILRRKSYNNILYQSPTN